MLDYIQERIEEIAKVSGKLEKQELVKEMCDDYPEAEKLLEYALSPFIQYGVAKSVKQPEPHEKTFEHHVTLLNVTDLLDRLANRELTGNRALEAIEKAFGDMTNRTATLVYNILQKDLRAGFSISTVNKALDRTAIYEFKTMLAHKYDPKKVTEWPVYVEPKLDGMRCVAIVKRTGVEFVSRSGKPITSIPHLEKQTQDLIRDNFGLDATIYIDGELTSGENFNISISALRKKDEVAQEAKFHIFDILTENEFKGITLVKQIDRIKAIQELHNPHPNLTIIHHHLAEDNDEVLELYNMYRQQGEEGVIVKDFNGVYEPKRSYAWMKIKDCNDADLKTVGYFEGEGKYEGMLGGIIVDHNGVEVRVGSGFSDAQRKEFWENSDQMHFAIAEIQYHEVTPDGSLRHPRFVRFRDDK
jgi:DNA ligase-1